MFVQVIPADTLKAAFKIWNLVIDANNVIPIITVQSAKNVTL